MKMLLRLAACFVLLFAPPLFAADPKPFDSPSIVVLGDSQIPFGSGPVILDFFENITTHCATDAAQKATLDVLSDMKVAVIGVRSTSLHSWTATKGRAKAAICKVDPKWKANAGAFGFINTSKTKYKQIGRGANYQFCEKGKSAFQAMFRPGYYEPKLIMLSFMGNAARRWAHDYEAALEDVEKMNAQLPVGVPCIFMTTAPSYSKKITDLRLKAQANLKRAFAESGSQCSFIEGANPKTVAANQGNKTFFRRSKSGRVKDPYHPNERGAKTFLKIGMQDICAAVFAQLHRTQPDFAQR